MFGGSHAALYRRLSPGLSTRNCIDLPGPGHSFQLVFAAAHEVDAGADNEVPEGARDEDFAGSRKSADTGGDVDCQATEVVSSDLALTRVKSHPDLQPEPWDLLANAMSAADGTGRTVERRKEPVSGGVDLASPKAP